MKVKEVIRYGITHGSLDEEILEMILDRGLVTVLFYLDDHVGSALYKADTENAETVN